MYNGISPYTVHALSPQRQQECLVSTLSCVNLFKTTQKTRIPAAGIRMCCRLIGITTSLEGHEHIVQNSGCIVLMNHQSMLDLLILAELWPVMDNCTVISKKEILYVQPFGLAAWLWGTIFIDRVKRDEAQAAVNRTGTTIRTRQVRWNGVNIMHIALLNIFRPGFCCFLKLHAMTRSACCSLKRGLSMWL